jgi:hypothetical protein
MDRPTIDEIAEELNERAAAHPIGRLHEIRKHLKAFSRRPGNSIFSSQTIADGWACHHGGRSELQFNIGWDGSAGAALRHGIAFSFETSQTLPTIDPLRPKVSLFNDYIRTFPHQYADMRMWHWYGDERTEYAPGPIPHSLMKPGMFVFLGKLLPVRRLDYELILSDFDRLLPLYCFVESGGKAESTLARAFSELKDVWDSIFPASTTSSKNSLAKDLEQIERREIDSTTKEALVNARVGQGLFREQVLRLWSGCCAVTGSSTQEAIRASHIKPWRESTDKERLDPHNGLPLIASLDALFDAGLISFDQRGTLIISSKLTAGERKIFGVDRQKLASELTAKTAEYLAYHRRKYGY